MVKTRSGRSRRTRLCHIMDHTMNTCGKGIAKRSQGIPSNSGWRSGFPEAREEARASISVGLLRSVFERDDHRSVSWTEVSKGDQERK